MPVHDTIIVCRPEQVQEAAILLSCCPAGRFTPLIVIERPPISEEEYRRRYDIYVEARNRRDLFRGTAPSDRERARQPLAELNAEVDLKAAALTAYRSWWRHQRLIADLLASLKLRRAIFLFNPPASEIDLINPLPISRISKQRQPSIPRTIEWLYVLSDSTGADNLDDQRCQIYSSLPELTDVAWRICRDAGGPPHETIDVPSDDVRAYFAGLHQSLRRGVPLRPNPALTRAPTVEGDSSNEAVLIEVSKDATRLVGVQYAHHRSAKLVLGPEMDVAAVERERSTVEGYQDKRWRAAGPNDKGLFLAMREYFLGDPTITDGIARIERTVSAQLPDAVVDAVGGRALTVFTAGIPYHFVRKKGADWSQKPIGHITGDASLLILTEVCQPELGSIAGFSVIFDPGYFQTRETGDVLAVLNKRISYPLVLLKAASSSLALQHLGVSMPLDVLFFNTHGSDKGIVLIDGELPAFKLQQRLTLSSRPFVFNSSCLSWVGVGREFVRVGARGYVGTLWSIDAEMAAGYARTVLDRITRHGLPVSRAMRATGLDAAFERAYVFIGTCNACVVEATLTGVEAERRRLDAIACALLDSLDGFVKFNLGHPGVPLITSLEDLLWENAEKVLAEYDRRWPQPHIDRIDLAIRRLRVLSHDVERRRGMAQQELGGIENVERMLKGLELEPKMEAARRAELLHVAGRFWFALGDVNRAIELLTQSVDAAEQGGESPMPPALELSDCLKATGRLPEAYAAAKRAAAFAHTGPASAKRKLLALGRLAQAANALGEHDAALGYAREGFELATSLDIPGERAEFKGDEVRTLLRLRRYDDAVAAAKEFLDLTRLAYDERREVDAYGTLAEAMLGKGDLAKAREYASMGLAQSSTRGYTDAVGDFLMDIANIESKAGDHTAGMDRALEAASVHAGTGRTPKIRNALGFASAEYQKLVARNPQTNTWGPLARKIKVELDLIERVDKGLRRPIHVEVVGKLGELILRLGPAPIRAQLTELGRDTEMRVRAREGKASNELVFISRALSMYQDLAAGRISEARLAAIELDRLSGGGRHFEEFVEKVGH
jgi:tetratricopeptide (TPR) repeat protein